MKATNMIDQFGRMLEKSLNSHQIYSVYGAIEKAQCEDLVDTIDEKEGTIILSQGDKEREVRETSEGVWKFEGS